jgi:hypothetical protein
VLGFHNHQRENDDLDELKNLLNAISLNEFYGGLIESYTRITLKQNQ